MALITLRAVTVGFGGPALLDGVDLSLEPRERVGLVGRNGAGKSTLLALIAGELQAETGEVARSPGMRAARLAQEVPQDTAGEVFDVVADGLGEAGQLLAEYHHVSHELAMGGASLRRLEAVQQRLEAAGGWGLKQRVETVLSRLSLPPDGRFETLSGGLKRRVLLARALVTDPDLLLLDEPTNHLDLEAIAWLEGFLLDYRGALLFVTHDRMLIRRLATRIVELDRGRLSDWPGDYATYLRRRQAALEAEERRQTTFDRRLAQEETWIRQGIRARRTRNEGRVRALEAMRAERRARREVAGQVRMRVQEAERSGHVVIEAEGIAYSYAGRELIRELSTKIERGDKVGILGPNGAGKTTLLGLLLGRLAPSRGRVRLGTRLAVAYFDQHRESLDPDRSVLESLEQGSERITIEGRSRHAIGYLQDFLFTPDRARSPVRALSGGERNRLLLARLFARPSNLLVLDEPTNDLDIETLELLEERLLEYAGTVLLVSHDRAFLDHVVTSTLVFEGDGVVREYVGGYEDWLRQRPASRSSASLERASPESRSRRPANERPRKLGYREQRELDALPALIEDLETELSGLHRTLADPESYRGDGETIAKARIKLAEVEAALARAFARWEALEAG